MIEKKGLAIFGILMCLLLYGCATSDRLCPAGSVKFKSFYPESARGSQATTQTTVTGTLSFPKDVVGKVPAMVILHGEEGIRGYREYKYSDLLNKLGIATLVVDSYTPRNVTETVTRQLRVTANMVAADAFAALRLLTSDPRIDATKVGVLGFSKGGTASLNAAFEAVRQEYLKDNTRFAAHIAFYPNCTLQYRTIRLSGAPILMLVGELDDLTLAAPCQEYAERIEQAGGTVDLIVYEKAPHWWDADYPVQWFCQAENYRQCRLEIDDQGKIFDMKRGTDVTDPSALTNYLTQCMTLGATGGRYSPANDKSLQDVTLYLKELFFAE